MKTGMLWFDDDPKRELSDKLERAATRFNEKYGRWPDLVYCNPRTSERVGTITLGRNDKHPMELKNIHSILPNHFWLGVSES